MSKVRCPVCGTLVDDDTYKDCIYCGWGYVGYEDELEPDEKEPYNLMSLSQAKALLRKGKTVFNQPLPHKKS